MPGTRHCGTIIVAKILKILVNSPLFLVFLFIPLLFLFLLEAIPIIISSIPYFFRTFALRKQQNPNDLMKELHCCLIQLEEIIGRINLTNINTKNAEGLSITQMIAKKDTLTMRIGILRNIYKEATSILSRYSPTEIRQECVIDVKQLSTRIDDYSARLRKLDMEIQGLNFLTELA